VKLPFSESKLPDKIKKFYLLSVNTVSVYHVESIETFFLIYNIP